MHPIQYWCKYCLPQHFACLVNPLPDDKILDWSKLKAFADDKLNVKMIISVSDRVGNIVGKGEIVCTSILFLFPQCIQNVSFPDLSRCVIVWEWVNGK